ncbi:hypothetical protein E0Z10_g9568 [Xylaria hypoxylon]|uniref:Nephrocystin 3-like N-terminal domain-containing protein n=1 Tax=Xylaria hypoxylon TaxID=37992 RepID=A0A4Z0Y8B9_9PEZI|nr:hypothetical protein E0Z10_g9568 [Xylaria hypoxylon]
MEPPAKRPRLARDTCGDASQLTEASKSYRDSGQPSNSFQGYGVQNTGSFTAGKDFIINIDKQSNTSTGVDKYRVLLDSLRFEQMDAREWSVKKAHAQTCAWFLKTPTYLNWTHENALHNDHNFLWIKGKPGAGKSTLMKFLLGRLRNQIRRAKSQEVLLSFFFNARGHDLEKTTAGLYRSLLLQLLEARTDLQYVLDNVRIGHRWTTESLKTVFEEAVQGLGDASLICLIDALDECQEAQIREMVSFLSGPDILQNRVRICFASRHYPHVTVKTAVDIVLEEQGGHSEDIASYLNSALIIKDSPIAALIRCEVQEKASGVFMWVVLVVDILNREHDAGRKHTLRTRIQQLPKDLHELFRNILTRDDNNMDGLLLCLQWVLLAQQPLTPKQLYFAIISGLEPDNLACCHSDDVSEDNIKRYILNNSKGLAESTKSKIPTVQFIHESVRDFLLKEDGLGRLNFSTNAIGQSHNTLKQCCLTYMNMEVMTNLEESTHDVITREFPFLEYANQGILYHAEQAQTHDVSQEDFLTTFPHSEWVKHHNILEKNNVRRYTSEVSLLYILAETDMSALIRAHSKRQSCFKVESERYGLPILAASATKSTAAIHTMLELEAEQLSESSRLNLHNLMPPDLDIRCTSSRNFKFKEESNLLCQLIEHGNEKVSLFFLATEQYDINAKCPQEKTILMLAAEKGFVVLVKVLLQMGADTLAADSFGRTPLHFASSGGHAEIAELLINGGANIATADRGGIKPLDSAATYGRTEVARLLLDRGADILAITSSEGYTPLHIAASYDSIEIAKLLIDCRADILAITSSEGYTPLHIAAHYGRTEIIKLLIDCGADVRATTSEGCTPLHIAAHYGRTEVARLLLDRGADILATTSEGYTPLHTAANHGSIEIIKLLIDCGADVRATTSEGYTPLHIAAHYGRTEVASLLLDRGADILATTSEGYTPLHIVASYDIIEISKLLIDCRANTILAITSEGYTPLRIAANNGRIKIGKLLIYYYSPDVRATTSKRYTPLHYDANYGSIEIAKLLIDRGADILATNSKGDTPLHLASKSKNFEVAELLVSRGAHHPIADKYRCIPIFRESVMPQQYN